MNPEPTTPSRRTSVGGGGLGTPKSFLSWLDLHELAGHVRDGELTEQLRLALQTLGESVRQAVLDRLERRERCRIVSLRLLQHLLPRPAKHEAPPEQVAVEQPPREAARALSLGAPSARHALRRGDGDVPEDCGVHELVDDPQPEGLLGPLHLAREDDVERGARADEPGQPLAATGRRQDAQLNLGEPELGFGVIGRDAVVARQGELEPATQAGPVDPDGDRLGKARHALQQLLTVRHEALRFGRAGERDELLDVGTRDEGVRLAREERHTPDRALALERFERREEVGFQRARDFVDRFALHVERDDRDPVGQLPAECGSRH